MTPQKVCQNWAQTGLSWLAECVHGEIHGDHNDDTSCDFYAEVRKN
jgi:hypothetical protein